MPREPIPALAASLARYMGAAGDLSPEALAIETDGRVSANTIRAALRGLPPNVGNLQVLASYFGTTVGDLLGEDPGGLGRIAPLASYAEDLEDDDIEVLAVTARRLASRRREPGPDYAHLPGWDRLTEEEKDEIREGIRLRDRAGRMKATGAAGNHEAGDSGRTARRPRADRGGPRGSTGA